MAASAGAFRLRAQLPAHHREERSDVAISWAFSACGGVSTSAWFNLAFLNLLACDDANGRWQRASAPVCV
jgi:hypothetical protein